MSPLGLSITATVKIAVKLIFQQSEAKLYSMNVATRNNISSIDSFVRRYDMLEFSDDEMSYEELDNIEEDFDKKRSKRHWFSTVVEPLLCGVYNAKPKSHTREF